MRCNPTPPIAQLPHTAPLHPPHPNVTPTTAAQVPKASHWEAVKETLRNHMPQIKMAFRLYTLIGAKDDSPDDMDMTQVA